MTERVMVFDMTGKKLKFCPRGKARKLLKNKIALPTTFNGAFAIKLRKAVRGEE